MQFMISFTSSDRSLFNFCFEARGRRLLPAGVPLHVDLRSRCKALVLGLEIRNPADVHVLRTIDVQYCFYAIMKSNVTIHYKIHVTKLLTNLKKGVFFEICVVVDELLTKC